MLSKTATNECEMSHIKRNYVWLAVFLFPACLTG